MATKPKVKLDEVEIFPPDYVPEDARLTDFLKAHGQNEDGVVRVYREGPAGFKDQVLENTFAMNEFDQGILLRPPYNGGKFRIYITLDGKTQHFPLRVTERKAEPIPQDNGMAAVAPLLAGMLEGFKALSAQIAQGQKQQMGVAETVELIKALQSMTPPPPVPVAAPDPFALLERVFAFQKQITPETPPLNEDGDVGSGALILEAIKTFGKPIADTFNQGLAARQGTAGTSALPNPATPALPNPYLDAQREQVQPLVSIPEESEMSLKMRMMKPVILAMAKTNADPAGYVDMVLDMLDDEQIEKYLTGPAWKAELLGIFPEAGEVMPWIERLRDAVDKALTEDAGAGNVDAGAEDAQASGG